MNVEKERKILDIAREAMALPEKARNAYIQEASGHDPEMIEEIAFLISVLNQPQDESFLSRAMHDAFTETKPENLSGAWQETVRPGQSVGRYRLVEKLGEGGMGCVFLAAQTEPVSRNVALKLVKNPYGGSETTRLLEMEPKIMATLSHPAIAQVYEVGSTPAGILYFAMEFIDGEPITEFVRRNRISLADRLRLLIQVCRGVQHAHQKAVLHRDLKPGNVLVTEIDKRRVAKIIDFGIARSVPDPVEAPKLREEILAGTPLYMSPEALMGGSHEIDTRTDVYALGILLFELVSGTVPFEMNDLTVFGSMRMLADATMPRPSDQVSKLDPARQAVIAHGFNTKPASHLRQLRGELDWITAKATAKNREDRYDSASQLAEDLERYLDGKPVSAAPPNPLYQTGKFVRRHLVALGVSLLVLVLLIGGILARTMEAKKASQEAEKARLALAQSREVTAFLSDLFQGANPMVHLGEVPTLRELVDRGYERLETAFGDQPVVQAQLLYTLSEVYAGLSDFSKERSLLEKSMALSEANLPPNHLDLGQTYTRLGLAYERRAEPEKAMMFQNKALPIFREHYGEDHSRTLKIRGHIGELYQAMGFFDRTEAIHLDLIERFRSIGNLVEVSSFHGYLSILYITAGRYREAGQQAGLSFSSYEQSEKTSPTNEASAYLRLGSAHYLLGDYQKALQYSRKGLELREKIFGLDHRATATALISLGWAFQALDRSAEAETHLLQAISILEKRSKSRTARALDALGVIYTKQDRNGEALAALERARKIKTEIFGEDHYRVGFTSQLIGDVLVNTGKQHEAEKAYRFALDSIGPVLGEDHPKLVPVFAGLGRLYQQQNRLGEAQTAIARARELSLKKLEPETIEYQQTMVLFDRLKNLVKDGLPRP